MCIRDRFGGGYQTVKRYVRKLRGKQPLQPRAVILTGPGEESQVDYGTGAMVRDAHSILDVLHCFFDAIRLQHLDRDAPRRRRYDLACRQRLALNLSLIHISTKCSLKKSSIS